MSYALSSPNPLQRSSLLSIVIGLHVALGLGLYTAKTVIPQVMEMPMIVDMLPAQPEIRPPEAKPVPVSKPQPVKQKAAPAAKTPSPPLETTSSSTPAPAAPVATPPEVRTAPAAPAQPAAEPISQARFDADYLKNPAPAYPPLSRRMGEEGKVILRVQVSPQGGADVVEIKTSSGSSRLDEAAQKTVRTWKFVPAKRGDTAIQSWVLVPIIFKLEQ